MIVLESRKYKLIEKIMQLNSDIAISKLEEQIQQIENQKFWEAVKPMRKSVTVEELKQEQNYKPITKDEFFKKGSELNITEPLGELLQLLSK